MSRFTVFEAQPTAGRILRAAAARDRLAQAYLFFGLEGTGKWAAALRTAQLMMCPQAQEPNHAGCHVCGRIASYNHPDVTWVAPLASRDKQKAESDGSDESDFADAQAKEWQEILAARREDPWAALNYTRRPYITVKRLRALQSTLSYTAAEGPRKVGIIINAETILPDAQAVLLKTIEEPPPDTHVILTTSDKSTLLSTILSRCQLVRFLPLPQQAIAARLIEELGVEPDRADRLAKLSGGGWSKAYRLAGEEWEPWRQAADMILGTVVKGSVDALIQTINTVVKPHPEQDKILFLFEVWQFRLHRAALMLSTSDPAMSPSDSESTLRCVFRCRAVLDEARAAVVGNVTPRTALAAAWLDVYRRLDSVGRAVLAQTLAER